MALVDCCHPEPVCLSRSQEAIGCQAERCLDRGPVSDQKAFTVVLYPPAGEWLQSDRPTSDGHDMMPDAGFWGAVSTPTSQAPSCLQVLGEDGSPGAAAATSRLRLLCWGWQSATVSPGLHVVSLPLACQHSCLVSLPACEGHQHAGLRCCQAARDCAQCGVLLLSPGCCPPQSSSTLSLWPGPPGNRPLPVSASPPVPPVQPLGAIP